MTDRHVLTTEQLYEMVLTAYRWGVASAAQRYAQAGADAAAAHLATKAGRVIERKLIHRNADGLIESIVTELP